MKELLTGDLIYKVITLVISYHASPSICNLKLRGPLIVTR